MTTVNLVDIITGISQLTFTGINTRDIDAVPEDVESLCPLFCPRLDKFLTNPRFTRQSFGAANEARMDWDYDLTWLYYHAPLADNIDWLSFYGEMFTGLAVIAAKFFSTNPVTGAVEMILQDIPDIAVLKDVVGKEYHGVEITIHIKEFVN